MQIAPNHDYSITPTTSVMAEELANENEGSRRKIQALQKELETLELQSRAGLRQFAGSDEDIQFNTRLVHIQYVHM